MDQHTVLEDAWLHVLARESFNAMDLDGDGRITKAEMLSATLKGGSNGPGVSGLTMKQLNEGSQP